MACRATTGFIPRTRIASTKGNGRLAALTVQADARPLTAEDGIAEQDRDRWKRLVADFQSCDLTQRGFASERGVSFSNLRYWI